MQISKDGYVRRCEAYVELYNGKFVQCGQTPVESHHRLTRGRGGTILDEAGETMHLMDCCAPHHKMAHDTSDGFSSGLLIDGSVTTCSQCQRPRYDGSHEDLSDLYGRKSHEGCVG